MRRTHSLYVLFFLLLSSAFASPQSLAGIGLPLVSHALPSLTNTRGPISLPLTRRFNNTGARNTLKFDQARARAIRDRQAGFSVLNSGAQVTNVVAVDQIVSYIVTVAVGNPPCEYNLLIDTGSSNTWIGADRLALPLGCLPTGQLMFVPYGSGVFFGNMRTGSEWTAPVTLAQGLTITGQSIGIAIGTDGFSGIDGILGIGPQGLTAGSLYPNRSKTTPTVTDTAYNAGFLTDYVIGISFRPSDLSSERTGELTFGGVNPSKFIGRLNYTPLTKVSPSNKYVGVDHKMTFGSTGMVMDYGSGILDTGTTLILICSDAFRRYQQHTGGVPDPNVGLLRITRDQYLNLQSLYFTIGGERYDLTPNAQIWPRALNTAIGGDADGIYLVVNDLGVRCGSGLDFITGMSFLERFYMVYDIGNSRAGLAYTAYTYADTN